MGSISDRERRRLRPGYRETAEFRNLLFEEFRSRGRYRNVIEADLRPIWKRARVVDDDNRLFYELRASADSDDGESLRDYVNAVNNLVAGTLRLTQNGTPAEWACNYLHADVEPNAGREKPHPDLPHFLAPPQPVLVWIETAALHIRVSPESANIVVVGDDDRPVVREAISGRTGYGDAEWDRIARHAHDMIDDQLTAMRASYEENNRTLATKGRGSFMSRNPSDLRRRRQEDIPLIASWVLGEAVPTRGVRERLRPLFRVLEIDPPSTSRR